MNRVNGFSSIADNTVCAKFGGPLDGTSATITLYDRLRVSGSDFSCDIDNFDVLSDRIAHELGHYLNLANTGLCSGIMGNNQAFLSNGQLSWDSSRLILTSECSLADFLAFTEYEQELAQCQSDPEPCTGTSPILIDLDRNQFHLSGSAVEFDIDADGELESIAWTAPEQDDGFLCLDRNGNGVIDDGGELFGDATRMLAGHTAAHGYIALGELDEETYGGNLDGAITPEDAMFEELRVWLDRNHDGVSQPEELLTLEEAGVLVLEFNFEWSPRTDGIGNEFKLLADALIVWRDQIQGTKTTDVFLKLNP